MRRITTKKLKITTIVLIVLSMTLIPALTSPVASPVIVVLSGDEPVMYTANKIGELLQNAMIVEKNSMFGTLILMRAVGEVIYVGHGTQQGIKVGGNIVGWENFAKEIRHIPSKTIYVAACYSENLAKIAEKKGLSKLIFGFRGLVDADEAAYITTATIFAMMGNVEKTIKLLNEFIQLTIEKINQPWKYKPKFLGYLPGKLGEKEAVAAVAAVATIVACQILGWAAGKFLAGKLAEAASRKWQITVAIALALVQVALGIIPWSEFVNEQAGNILTLIQEALNSLSWWEWIILVGLAVVSGIAEAFTFKTVSMALLAVDIGIFIVTFLVDYNDPDDNPADYSDIIDFIF
ncbi:MAG: hypothetical protein ACTSYM_13085 [Candidatus Baldrarchaeia archaeon]